MDDHVAPDGYRETDSGEMDWRIWDAYVAISDTLAGRRETILADLRRRGLKADDLYGIVGAGVLLGPKSVEGRRAIRMLDLRGYTAPQIAALLDMDPEFVEDFLDKWGAGSRSKTIVDLWREGMTCPEIADHLGISKTRVYDVLDRAQLKPVQKQRRRYGHLVHHRQKAAELYRQGWTYSSIAALLGISLGQVRTVLRAAWEDGTLPEYGERKRKGEEGDEGGAI